MAGSNRHRTATLTIGLVALAASTSILVGTLAVKGLGAAANVGQLLSVALAIPPLVLGLIMWWRASRRAVASDLVQMAELLARLVTREWEDEAAIRSLDDPDPIPVQWRLTVRASLMDHASSVADDGTVHWEGSSSQVRQLVQQYRLLRRRRLVVHGPAGSGKTTLAVQLLRELLRTRRNEEPVPIFVPAGRWNVSIEPDLWKWLADYLKRTYHEVSSVEELAADRRILPIIDGLDEIALGDRTAVLRALNQSLGVGQLILTCRTEEYIQAVTNAGNVLTGAAVVEPLPLDVAQSADYLKLWLPPEPTPAWRRILDTLRDGTAPALAEVCSTPLGLWLVRTTGGSRGSDIGTLADPAKYPNTAEMKRYLFSQLIPAVIESRPPATRNPDREPFRPRTRHDPRLVTHSLSLVAAQLSLTAKEGPVDRNFGWWDVGRLPIPRGVARTAGCVIALVGGTAIGLTGVRLKGIQGPVIGGILAGFLCGLVPIAWLKDLEEAFSWVEGRYVDPYKLQRDLSTCFVPVLAVSTLSAAVIAGGFRAVAGMFFALPFVIIAARITALVGSQPRSIVPKRVGTSAAKRIVTFGPLLLVLVALALVVLSPMMVDSLIFEGVGLFVGLIAGLAAAFDAVSEDGIIGRSLDWWRRLEWGMSATATLRWGRAVYLLRIGIVGLLVGLFCALAGGGGFGFVAGLAIAPAFGLAFVLADRYGGSGYPALAYLLVTGWLAAHREVPWRFMKFLDDAHRLGLLRKIGDSYQFRHAELHDYLGDQSDDFAKRAS
jgi:NACHT domain-containing protein